MHKIYTGADSLIEFQKLISCVFPACFVLADNNSLKYCYPKVVRYLPQHQFIKIQAGEESKTLQTCELIWGRLTGANANRKSLLVNLGGGVISDMGGFAAACYKRGIKFVNLPTTLLAMVDASVGGKTGIDFMGLKNQLGVFKEPEAVFIYTDFLSTLPEREILSGFAEIMKHYLIADKAAFNELAVQRPAMTNVSWDGVVIKNIRIKTDIVTQDPEEQNVRAALNFGHTIGHAVESLFLQSNGQKLLHGEAVALGMICESFCSMRKGMLVSEELDLIIDTILHYFDLPFIPDTSFEGLLALMKQDKKNENNGYQFTLLKGTGNFSVNHSVEQELIVESLNYYNSMLE